MAQHPVKTGITFLNFCTKISTLLNTGLSEHIHFHLINNLKMPVPQAIRLDNCKLCWLRLITVRPRDRICEGQAERGAVCPPSSVLQHVRGPTGLDPRAGLPPLSDVDPSTHGSHALTGSPQPLTWAKGDTAT